MACTIPQIPADGNLAEFFRQVNTCTDEIFGLVILIIIVVSALIAFIFKVDTAEAFAASTFLGVTFGYLLYWMEILQDMHFFIIVIIFAISLVGLWYSKSQ